MRAEVLAALARALDEERLVVLATVIAGPGTGDQALLAPEEAAAAPRVVAGALPGPVLAALAEPLAEAFAALASRRVPLEVAGEEAAAFVEVHAPRPQLIVVGAVHAAIPLVRFARELGFRTVVVDPRTAFATAERFADADELVQEWPDRAFARLRLDETTYVALLSHDLKLDLPALEAVLPTRVRYVGALGSKKTHAKRVAALAERGVPEARIARIHSPIGLPLGGRRPEEIALSIIAEIVAVSHGEGYRPPV